MAAIPSRLMHRGRTVPRWAVVCAGLSPILLTLAWLAGDLLQPASYSPIRQTISALAGQGATDRWLMTAILFAVGGSYLVTAAGLTGLRLPARILLVIAGICSAGIASSPVLSDGPTALHLAWAALGAVTTAVWPAVADWRAPYAAEDCERPRLGHCHSALRRTCCVARTGSPRRQRRRPGGTSGFIDANRLAVCRCASAAPSYAPPAYPTGRRHLAVVSCSV